MMARHVGLFAAYAWLEKLPDTGIANKQWIGHTKVLSIINKKITHKKYAMFASAGAVAEFFWQRVSVDEALDTEVWYDSNIMSKSDWAGCRCEPGNPTLQLLKTIKTVFSLFDRKAGKLWPALLFEARCLIENSRHTSETVDAFLKKHGKKLVAEGPKDSEEAK
jgi:hypothetical protein